MDEFEFTQDKPDYMDWQTILAAYKRDIRAAEIRGATWALEKHWESDYGSLCTPEEAADEALEIVDERRKK